MTQYRKWTQGAVECYSRGGVCRGCEIFEIIGKQCRMKQTVISLWKQLGAPPDVFDIPNNFNKIIDDTKIERRKNMTIDKANELTKSELEVLALLLDGFNYTQISEKLGKTKPTIQVYASSIFKKRDCNSLQELLIKELKADKTDPQLDNLRRENEALRDRIAELEQQPKPVFDFDQLRHNIQGEIDQLTAKLKALDLLESEIA